MTSAENSVLEPPNLKILWGGYAQNPHWQDSCLRYSRYNPPRCKKIELRPCKTFHQYPGLKIIVFGLILTPKLSPYILACQQSSSREPVFFASYVVGRRSLGKQSLWWRNVLCDCVSQCASGSLYCTRRRWSRRRAEWSCFCGVRVSSQLSCDVSSLLSRWTSFTVHLQQARSLVATSKLFGSVSINLLSPVVNCPCRTSLRMRRSFMRWTCPSHLRRRWLSREYMLVVPVRDSISLLVTWSCHLTPRMRLRHHRCKEFKRCSCLM